MLTQQDKVQTTQRTTPVAIPTLGNISNITSRFMCRKRVNTSIRKTYPQEAKCTQQDSLLPYDTVGSIVQAICWKNYAHVEFLWTRACLTQPRHSQDPIKSLLNTEEQRTCYLNTTNMVIFRVVIYQGVRVRVCVVRVVVRWGCLRQTEPLS